ncbi:hypothetical protein GCM10007160_32670 [Litchfieldella qijiaojingensis]|uniref:Uncharacterized protein n=1 Tax=Litchfieldella qijiaojingensis TaxID=980347 RepID=A0ABQ2Z5B0_9GAMM|nr:hypothetical protein [Halomonas qijiaojingensis]GGY02185.1 hypothetical protein GCM10007160_32670 [Halomonas qijiaojingensis]
MMRQIKRYSIPFSKGMLIAGLSLPVTVQAYVGPGAGLSLLTALWGLIAAIGVAVFFIVMWPIRRIWRRKKASQAAASQTSSQAAQNAAPSVQQDTDTRTSSVETESSQSPRS